MSHDTECTCSLHLQLTKVYTHTQRTRLHHIAQTLWCGVYTAPDGGREKPPDAAREETRFTIATVIVDTATFAGAQLQTEGLHCCQSGE